MARHDPRNRAAFWVAPHLPGVSLLRADFGTLTFARHVHEELVIALTEAGAGRFVTRGIRDVGPPRSILVFNPGEAHEGGVAGAEGWAYRGLYLDPAALAWLAEGLESPPLTAGYFHDVVLQDAATAALLVEAHATLSGPATRLRQESLFLAAMRMLLQRHARPKPPERRPADHPVQRALEALRADPTADWSVEALAALAGLSPWHFIRSFRRALGLPPHSYLLQLRLERARGLLAAGEAPAAAAAAAGFYDQSHLAKLFKRTWGITPGQYVAALR